MKLTKIKNALIVGIFLLLNPFNSIAKDVIWFDDILPKGNVQEIQADSWKWVNFPAPYSGKMCHVSDNVDGFHQHYFTNTSQSLFVEIGDSLFCYIFYIQKNAPKMIAIQWHDKDNGWEHRAYWGSDKIEAYNYTMGSKSRMGDLPQVGQWVRLAVSARTLGLEGKNVDGMAFTLFDGSVAWDCAGKCSGHVLPSYFKNGTIHLVQSSHSDLGFRGSIKEDTKEDIQIYNEALNIMNVSPDFKFSSEDVWTFNEVYKNSDRKDEFDKRIMEGRFTVTATYTQPYENLLSGEQMIRQFYLGKKDMQAKYPSSSFSTRMDVDPPQRMDQIAQIQNKSGIKYLCISRMYNTMDNIPNNSIIKWFSPDGSFSYVYALTHYCEYGLQSMYPVNLSSPLTIKPVVDSWDDYYTSHHLNKHMILFLDHDSRTPDNYDRQIEKWNIWAKENGYPKMEYSSFEEAMDSIVKGGGDFDIIKGERPNLWLYEAAPSNHIAVSRLRDGSTNLVAAEVFASIKSMNSANLVEYPSLKLKQAWLNLNTICHGWQNDCVDSFKTTFGRALDISNIEIAKTLSWYTKGINTKKNHALIVYNSLSWERTDPIVCTIPANAPKNFVLTTSKGEELIYQVLPNNQITFIAKNIPALGYSTYYLKKGRKKLQSNPIVGTNWTSTYENDFYKITPANSSIASIFDKSLQKELLETSKFKGAELVELESPGNGAGEFTTFNGPSKEGVIKISNLHSDWICTESGQVRTVFESKQKMEHNTYLLKLILYNDLKRIDFEPSILNWDGTKAIELRLFFPLNSTSKEVIYDVPYAFSKVGKSEINPSRMGWGDMHQPRETNNFIYAGGNDFGLTLSSSVAAIDYIDPTENPQTNTILQPILLATRSGCGDNVVWAQKGDHTYHFSIYSHTIGIENGWHLGVQTNNPLYVISQIEKTKKANFPESQSWLKIDKKNVVVSTLKKSENEDSYTLRIYEALGEDTDVNIILPFPIKMLWQTNLLEDNVKKMNFKDNTFSFKIGHNAIETFKFIFRK